MQSTLLAYTVHSHQTRGALKGQGQLSLCTAPSEGFCNLPRPLQNGRDLFPSSNPSKVWEQQRFLPSVHLFLASLVPVHSSGWCSHFWERSRRPWAPHWPLVLPRPAEKAQEMKVGGRGCTCWEGGVQSHEAWRGLSLEASNPGFSCLWSSVCPSPRTGQPGRGAPEPSFPSAWGMPPHFSVGHILN